MERVAYWREEPLEVDGVIEGSWGSWAVEIKTGNVTTADFRGLFEFTRRFPNFRALVLCDPANRYFAERAGIETMPWRDFLLSHPGSL